MSATYKVLGQSNPAATTNTTLYTAPSGGAIGSTLAVCNQAATSATFRVAVRPAGATLAAQHYMVYDVSILPNESQFFTLGLSLASTDVVTVYASSATLSFSLFGAETP